MTCPFAVRAIAHASRSETLFPGEFFGSGTVGSGCGLEQMRFLKPGDVMRLGIEKLGEQQQSVHAWDPALIDGPVVAAADRARSGLAFTVFSGPEGGLSPAEQALARQHRFAPVSLGPRVLRADTAPLAMLAVLGALPTD